MLFGRWNCAATALVTLSMVTACAGEPSPRLDFEHRQIATPEQAVVALATMAEQLLGIGVAMAEQEEQLFAALQHLPVAEGLEFDDDDDLAEFEEGLNLLFGGLQSLVEGGALTELGELRVPPALFCGVDGRSSTDPVFQSCVEKVRAFDLHAVIGADPEGSDQFVVVARFGDRIEPVLFRFSSTAMEVEVDLATAREALDVVLTLLDIDLGQAGLDDFFALRGRISARVSFGADRLDLEVRLPQAIHARIASATLDLAQGAATGGDALVSLSVGRTIDVAVNLGPVAALGMPLGLATDQFGAGAVGDFVWDGLRYRASRDDGERLPFAADVGDLHLTVRADGESRELIGRRARSGAVRGTADGPARLGRFDLRRGWQTTYPEGSRTEQTRLGLTAERVLSPGAVVIDFRRSTLAKAAAQIELAFQGQLTKIDQLLCAADGTIRLELTGVEPAVLTASADEDDNCLVGFFSKENGEPRYQYETL